MAKVPAFTLMELAMRVLGFKGKDMDKEYIYKLMAIGTKEIGKRTSQVA